jgi:hypothetical protein
VVYRIVRATVAEYEDPDTSGLEEGRQIFVDLGKASYTNHALQLADRRVHGRRHYLEATKDCGATA